MVSDNIAADAEPIEIELKDPSLAALLAWLWPGAGHIYQGRHGKAILFMVCILGTFFFGLTIGGGRVVYASFKKEDRRLPYLCQVGVGLPALPALVQTIRMHVLEKEAALFNGFMAPPQDFRPNERDELASWHAQYNFKFELGTLFTMVAGLLNVLAIYDAGCGPVIVVPGRETDKPPPDKMRQKKDRMRKGRKDEERRPKTEDRRLKIDD